MNVFSHHDRLCEVWIIFNTQVIGNRRAPYNATTRGKVVKLIATFE